MERYLIWFCVLLAIVIIVLCFILAWMWIKIRDLTDTTKHLNTKIEQLEIENKKLNQNSLIKFEKALSPIMDNAGEFLTTSSIVGGITHD